MSSHVPSMHIRNRITPMIWKVGRQPNRAMSALPTGMKIAEPPPYPATINPTTRPRLSGNHFDPTGMGVA